jgi:hypothetical protein
VINTCEKLLNLKRFRQIVVGARADQPNGLIDTSISRYEKHRTADEIGKCLLEYVLSIHIRKADITYNKVGTPLAQTFHRS